MFGWRWEAGQNRAARALASQCTCLACRWTLWNPPCVHLAMASPSLLQAPPMTSCRCHRIRPFASGQHRSPLLSYSVSARRARCKVFRPNADAGDAALLENIPEPEDARGAISVRLWFTMMCLVWQHTLGGGALNLQAGCRWASISTMQASMTARWPCLRKRSACRARASNSSGVHPSLDDISMHAQCLVPRAISMSAACMRRDKPPAISNGEKQAALYNIACCYSRQGSLENSVRALACALPLTLSSRASLHACIMAGQMQVCSECLQHARHGIIVMNPPVARG